MLLNPKYPQNVGGILRTCSCYGIKQLWTTGNRVPLEPSKGYRLPREERMKGYRDVKVINYDKVFDMFPGAAVVGIEVFPGSIPLPSFQHPPNALYVFGPEDGGLTSMERSHCHFFVSIPTRHCLNLATAVATVLYDRQSKLNPDATLEETLVKEGRGFEEANPIYEEPK